MRFLLIFLAFWIATAFARGAQDAITYLKLPPGFAINIYVYPISGPRAMCLGSKDIVFVGSFYGRVYAIVPDETMPYGTKTITIATGLRMPTGVAFYDGDLYVIATDRIYRYDNIEANLNNPPEPTVITQDIPDVQGDAKNLQHAWRYIRIGPDKKIYIAIGGPCNSCISNDDRFGTIMRMNLDGSDPEVYVRGVRDSQGFDWDPYTRNFWFTDNSRGQMGNLDPPDELNYIPAILKDYGFPYVYGDKTLDPTYGDMFPLSDFKKPSLLLPPHVSPNGIVFYTGRMFPAKYEGQLFIAEHGSQFGGVKVGYKVISVELNKQRNKVIAVRPFITGWLVGQVVYGRPVDLLVLRDGSMLISDDFGNVIYRVTYNQ